MEVVNETKKSLTLAWKTWHWQEIIQRWWCAFKKWSWSLFLYFFYCYALTIWIFLKILDAFIINDHLNQYIVRWGKEGNQTPTKTNKIWTKSKCRDTGCPLYLVMRPQSRYTNIYRLFLLKALDWSLMTKFLFEVY